MQLTRKYLAREKYSFKPPPLLPKTLYSREQRVIITFVDTI